MKMKKKELLDSIKCLILILLGFIIFSCATNKQYGFPSELLGTWLYEFENSQGLPVEQAYIFNSDGSGIVETRYYGHVNWAGKTISFLRPEDIYFINLFPSSKKGKIEIVLQNSIGQISYTIVNNHLVISGITNSMFQQSAAKYRKLSDEEVEKWLLRTRPVSEQ
jgi:hypothetical protein